ncbi:MAG: 30S ribosomal protein S6 [Armatimonadetes bacterium]|nr:30S ribosomal protein S6 [Armatimonadota bacterium]
MTKYEAFYLVSPALGDTEVQAIADKFKAIVEKEGGTVESAGKWDKRKLAYEIGGLKEATYILMNFEAGPKVPAELRRQMRNSDEIVRHMVLLRDNVPA